MARIAQSITDLIAGTPLIDISPLAPESGARILAKLEFFNPGASVKDRLAFALIDDAETKGLLKPGGTIVEATSGNTGIGLAMVAAAKGYQLLIFMPESMSIERRNIIKAFGAQLILTPATEGMGGAVRRAEEYATQNPEVFVAHQFENQANVQMHIRTTGPEIWNDTDGKVDIFVAGVGTGGTITGVSAYLKQQNPALCAVAVEPTESPVLAGGKAAPHRIQGIGAGFIPAVVRPELIDEIFHVNIDQSLETARTLTRQTGIFSGISSGANIYAALQLAARPENQGKTIVAIICDTGERYLSTPLYQFEQE